MVDTSRALVVVFRIAGRVGVVIPCQGRVAGSAEVLRARPGELRDPVGRNDVARERNAGVRVLGDLGHGGKVTAELGGRRHVGVPDRASADAPALVVEEEERFVVNDRPAHAGAELVLAQRRLRASEVVRVSRIQFLVAQKLKRCPVPLIRSRLRYNHHLPAGALAEFGSVRVALHIELAYGVHAEQHPARSSRLHVVLRRAGKLHAVQQKKILLRPVSGNSEIVSRGGIRYPCSAGFHPGEIHDAGIQRQQQIVTSPVQREVLYLLFAHQAGNISRRRAYHGSILSNRDLGLHRAHF